MLGLERFAGRSVLDVGAFDGFYSFLAEHRGARRVVAVDNEQYVEPGRRTLRYHAAPRCGFRAIAELTGSQVEYRQMDAERPGADETLTSHSASVSCPASPTRSRFCRRLPTC